MSRILIKNIIKSKSMTMKYDGLLFNSCCLLSSPIELPIYYKIVTILLSGEISLIERNGSKIPSP